MVYFNVDLLYAIRVLYFYFCVRNLLCINSISSHLFRLLCVLKASYLFFIFLAIEIKKSHYFEIQRKFQNMKKKRNLSN